MLIKTSKCSKLEKAKLVVAKKGLAFGVGLSFKKLTTVGVGGKIALTVFPKSISEVRFVLKLAKRLKIDTIVLGKGSNVLASDDFFDGIVICLTKLKGIERHKNIVKAQAGIHTVLLANKLKDFGLSGAEHLFCLPATLGGAVVMNAGCFGMETQNIVKKVTVLTKNGFKKTFKHHQCGFGYRKSIFADSDFVVVEVKLKLKEKPTIEIATDMQAMLTKKRQTQPLKEKSMGCVFYNQSKTASLLIDKAGLKGRRVGGAVVSTKHAGFIINDNKATSSDILNLMNLEKETVKKQFNETLLTEIKMVNF